jgi:hypothetical protein
MNCQLTFLSFFAIIAFTNRMKEENKNHGKNKNDTSKDIKIRVRRDCCQAISELLLILLREQIFAKISH